MGKLIFIGDPHVQPSNLEESDRLMSFVVEVKKRLNVPTLVLPGDLFHNHAVLRMEVLDFWSKWLKKFSETFDKVHVIPGNHDQPGDKQRENSMSALDVFQGRHKNAKIWTQPGKDGEMGFIPHTSNHNAFLSWAKTLYHEGVSRLFCHQTFDGSKYDNGFYAPDGIDTKMLPPFDEVVSGHVHTEQNLGPVFYPGTPKWDSLSDANQEKGIWVSYGPRSWEKISTAKVCTPIIKKTFTESSFSEKDLDVDGSVRLIVELVGSSSWIAKTSQKIRGRARVVARPTDSHDRKKAGQQKQKDIFEYLDSYKNISSDKEKLKTYLENLCKT